jgi:type IV pilus assembly protein PilQ
MELDVNKDTPNTRLSNGCRCGHRYQARQDRGAGRERRHGGHRRHLHAGNAQQHQRIPFFGDLPYIGFLFKNREIIDDKTELLVFITPRIVAENLSVR